MGKRMHDDAVIRHGLVSLRLRVCAEAGGPGRGQTLAAMPKSLQGFPGIEHGMGPQQVRPGEFEQVLQSRLNAFRPVQQALLKENPEDLIRLVAQRREALAENAFQILARQIIGVEIEVLNDSLPQLLDRVPGTNRGLLGIATAENVRQALVQGKNVTLGHLVGGLLELVHPYANEGIHKLIQ